VQFNVSFDTADSPDLASLTASEQQTVLDTINAAATIWSWYLTPANITLDLAIIIDNSLFSGSTLAQGGPTDFYATGRTFGGQTVYDATTAIELRTGQDRNGSQPDLQIGLTVDSIRSMYFKTDDFATVPFNATDALSVFLHEIEHGLGMVYLGDEQAAPGVAVYDTFVQNGLFVGANARAAYNTFSSGVPLEPGNLAHVSESGLGNDLMSPAMNRGVNAHISALDLAILQDIGIAVRRATSGDDVLHAVNGVALYMGAGNDTGYALPNGSTLNGEDGNDRLIGNRGFDTLFGGNDDDYLEGGGSNDQLNGGAGTDIARYFGLASDYQITRLSRTSVRISDMRAGSPDGTDTLTDIEKVQWSDGSVTNVIANAPPVVTTSNQALYRNQTVSLSSLLQVSDADGDAILTYQLWDSVSDPSSGYFIINGAPQPPNTVITLSAANLSQASFVVGTVADNLQIRAFDGFDWSAADDAAWSPFTITPIIPPPVVTTANVDLVFNQTVALSSLFSVSDPNNLPITKYQLWDSTRDPNSGHFVVNGAPQAAGTVIEITAAQLAQTSFVAGSAASDDLQIRAFDGLVWSAADNAAWAPFTVTPGYPKPVVTTSNVTLTQNQTVALSSLFSVSDPNGRAITRYQLWDSSTDPNSGHFVVNGLLQPSATVIDITAAQLAQTFFTVGILANDNLQIRAYDGLAWSASDTAAWSPFTVTAAPPHPPLVTASNVTAPANTILAFSSLFSVSDTGGLPITQYQILEWSNDTSDYSIVDGGDPSSGQLLLDGWPQAPLTPIIVSADQLSRLSFLTGTRYGDYILVRAFNGKFWSSPDIMSATSFKIIPTGPLNHRPELTLEMQQSNGTFYPPGRYLAQRNQALSTSDFSAIYDADNDAITQYQIMDNTPDPLSGYWVVNGTPQPAGTIITLTPAQWAQAGFVTGTIGDNVKIRASDGKNWSTTPVYPSNWIPADISWGDLWIDVTNSVPVVSTSNMTAAHSQTLALSSLFSVSDADGDTITGYQISDGTDHPSSGRFFINGVAQAAGTIIDVTPAQLAQTSFVTGTVGDSIHIRASDGARLSDWSYFYISVPPNNAPVVTTNTVTKPHLQSVALSSLFSVSDADGDTITKYELWDSNRDPSSGHFVVNGQVQAAGTVIEITPGQLAQTSFVTGAVSDSLQIRASDGYGWSAADNAAWAPFTVTVAPNSPPVVDSFSHAVLRGTVLDLSIPLNAFGATDADGDTITRYQLWDSTRDPNSGNFVVNNVVQPAGVVIDITAAQLAQTSFVAGKISDNLQVRAFDGISWSAADTASWSPFTIGVLNSPPVVGTSNVTRQHSQTLALSSLFSASDSDGDPITKYQLWDSNRDPNSGYFMVNGVAQAAGTIIDVTAAQLAQTFFVTGIVNDSLQIRAFDGIDWSAGDNASWAPFTVSVPAYTSPSVTTADINTTPGQTLALSSLFSVNDPDGDNMTRYQLWDSTADPNSGHFVVNGVTKSASTVIDVTAAEFSQTNFLTGTLGDALQIRAFDGTSWSAADNLAWAPFHINVS
jgi:hypothetical protein